jgi:hypothetical protein
MPQVSVNQGMNPKIVKKTGKLLAIAGNFFPQAM